MDYQKPNPFPKSIFDNVAYGLRIHGEEDEDYIAQVVEESLKSAAIWDEVKDKLDKSAMGLSGGQQQRLCIARTIAVSPEVILMDEPCSALDPISTLKIENLIHKLKEKYTIVMVTHNMHDAIVHGNRLIMMGNGKVILDISGEEKKKLTVDDLLQKFEKASGSKLENDRMLLSKGEE